MTRRLPGTIAGVTVVVAFGLWAGQGRGGDDKAWKAFIPDDAYRELVQREAKIIQESLKKLDEDTIKRARVGAVMIMGYAASHAAPSAKTNSEADTAQTLRDIVGAKAQEDRARMYAEQLATGKVSGSSKAAKRNWRGGDVSVPDLMDRSEEHTSELQSRGHLVCRLLLE